MSDRYFTLSAGTASPQWPAGPRAPLPPFDLSGNPVTTLPTNLIIPTRPDRLFWRGNAWSKTYTGLPFVEGASSDFPDDPNGPRWRCLEWFLDRWSLDWQQRILNGSGTVGDPTCPAHSFTHYTLSWPDSRAMGLGVDQFRDMAWRVTDNGFFVHAFLGSKVYDPHDQTWDTIKDRIEPVLRALIAAKAVSSVALWEMDLWNIPGPPLQTILDGISAIAVPADVHHWAHFSPERTSWFIEGSNRYEWWARQSQNLVGILYQGNVEWSMGERQARMEDTQRQFGDPSQVCALTPDGKFRIVAWEMDAIKQFTNLQPDEDHSDMHQYLDLCSPGAVPISGLGNGGRLPNGGVI